MGETILPEWKAPAVIFLLVGGDVVVRSSEIVAVLDQNVLQAAPTREFIGFCRRKGQVEDLSGDGPAKSAVICQRRVLLSPFSGATLRRRLTRIAY